MEKRNSSSTLKVGFQEDFVCGFVPLYLDSWLDRFNNCTTNTFCGERILQQTCVHLIYLLRHVCWHLWIDMHTLLTFGNRHEIFIDILYKYVAYILYTIYARTTTYIHTIHTSIWRTMITSVLKKLIPELLEHKLPCCESIVRTLLRWFQIKVRLGLLELRHSMYAPWIPKPQ